MNRKGFTLVELLAIIMLLTILVVLVITNVTGPLDSSNSTIENSQINVLLAAAKNYAEDNINDYASCTYNTNLPIPSLCSISTRVLVDEGYLNEEEIDRLDDKHTIIACYNSDNTTISVYYKDKRTADCKDVESHRIHIEPQIMSTYYLDTATLSTNISTNGVFESFVCEVSPDDFERSSWATCTISSDHKSMYIQYYGREDFPYLSSQNLTIRIIGKYKDENDNEKELTKNFRLVIFK